MAEGDLKELTEELLIVDDLFYSEWKQHEARRWEYAMALRAAKASGVLEARGIIPPLALDVGGAHSPLHRMLDRIGFSAHVIDPELNMSLHEALISGARAPFVTCVSVIEHVEDLYVFVSELREIVQPGGVLFLTADIWDPPLESARDTTGNAASRERIFTPRSWTGVGEEFCRGGEMEPLGVHDYGYGGNCVFDYSFASMALRKAER